MRLAVLAAAALAAIGCAPSVAITRSGPPVALARRPADCEIEFFRAGPPQRPYDEVAAVNVKAYRDDPAGAQEALREAACEIGADAVLVTQEFVSGYMTGAALSYRELRDQHRADAEARWATIAPAVDRDRAALRAQAAAMGRDGPAADFVPGRVRQSVRPRTHPDRRSTELVEVAAGAPIWMAPSSSAGWRRVWTPDARFGWLEDSLVEALPSPPVAVPGAPEARQPASR